MASAVSSGCAVIIAVVRLAAKASFSSSVMSFKSMSPTDKVVMKRAVGAIGTSTTNVVSGAPVVVLYPTGDSASSVVGASVVTNVEPSDSSWRRDRRPRTSGASVVVVKPGASVVVSSVGLISNVFTAYVVLLPSTAVTTTSNTGGVFTIAATAF